VGEQTWSELKATWEAVKGFGKVNLSTKCLMFKVLPCKVKCGFVNFKNGN
jgi:hypothetical protein